MHIVEHVRKQLRMPQLKLNVNYLLLYGTYFTCGLLASVVGRCLDSQNLRVFQNQRIAGDC